MNYQVSSNNFSNPLLKELLEKIKPLFDSLGLKFFIIGATARDMIMDAFGEKSGRATHDLDIAVAIPDWSEYSRIENELIKIEGIEKDKKQKQRFIFNKLFKLDIVPFGNIKNEDDKIFWPPDESVAMSVLGFSEVEKSTQKVTIDESLTIEIASLAGIFILKIIAWLDRHLEGNKDADDMGFILTNYLFINEDRAVHEHYEEIYEQEDFNVHIAGATLLGIDIATILKPNSKSKEKIAEILKNEIDKQEESKLINQIIESNRALKYEEVRKCIVNIIEGINKEMN